jgi:hypothetical protein
MGSGGIQAYTAYTACFWAWEGSFVQNNEKQFQGRGGGDGKRGNLLQVLRFFAVFVRGSRFFGWVLKELIHRNRGVNGQFCDVFERIMRKNWFKNQVPGCFYDAR